MTRKFCFKPNSTLNSEEFRFPFSLVLYFI
ncbi:hypothetical protein SEUBUCD646_0D01800 [Saccharomyces eubayanus]|uniref:Uncharacterized protein n=1 Tax=Saccharomyces eubayanus TaxID=1080349 RepID=A0ABN8VT24_SACEU|nr:hypothetical protein SEUBUCD650_0D01790 [Saccharomyces eubayanus]CAI1935809.1 hypothetical protein SEUBUCD646_0D01800 [Saccharomyces eubayanus]